MTTKIYNLHRDTLFRIPKDSTVHIPPAAPEDNGQVYRFGRVDGMYSWSIGVEDGERYYFAGWTEVELLDGECPQCSNKGTCKMDCSHEGGK